MARVATPENEHYFLRIALHGTAHHVETLVRAIRFVQPNGESFDSVSRNQRFS